MADDYGGMAQAGVSLVNAYLQREGQKDANEQNAALFRENLAFQERMRSTAYQTTVKDLEAAGLNPMLAYGHGPSPVTGGGSAPKMESTAPNISQSAQALFTNATLEKIKADTRQADATAANQREQANVNELEVANRAEAIGKTGAEAELARSHSAESVERTKGYEVERRKLLNEINHISMNTELSKEQARNAIQERLNIALKAGLIKAETRHASAASLLAELEAPRARNVANVQDSPWMVKVSPYLRDLMGVASTGASVAAGAAAGGLTARRVLHQRP